MCSDKTKMLSDVEAATIDGLDQLADLPPGPMRDEILYLVRTVGVKKALFATFDLLDDKRTPAAARVTAINTIFKIAGFLEKPTEPEDPFGIDRMSAAELEEALKNWRHDLSEIERKQAEGDDGTRPRPRSLVSPRREAVDIFS